MRAAIISTLLMLGGAAGLAMWVAGPARQAEAAAPTVPANVISSVHLGSPDLPPQSARAIMLTQRGGRLDDAALAHDRAALQGLLVERGHWAATVAPATITTGSYGAHVTFDVTPGAIFHAGAVHIDGLVTAQAAKLVEALTLATGDLVTTGALERNRALLTDLLVRQGLRHRTVTWTVVADAATHRLDVAFVVAN